MPKLTTSFRHFFFIITQIISWNLVLEDLYASSYNKREGNGIWPKCFKVLDDKKGTRSFSRKSVKIGILRHARWEPSSHMKFFPTHMTKSTVKPEKKCPLLQWRKHRKLQWTQSFFVLKLWHKNLNWSQTYLWVTLLIALTKNICFLNKIEIKSTTVHKREGQCMGNHNGHV